MENSYSFNDIEIIDGNQQADLYDEYESAYDDDTDTEPEAVRRFTVWHLLVLLILLTIIALVLVYLVLPFVASFGTAPTASQLLPNPVQA